MHSPSLHYLLIQARVEDLQLAGRASPRQRTAADISSEIRRTNAAPLSAFVKGALERFLDRTAREVSEDAQALHGLEITGHRSTTTWSQRS
jgi:hypothetical protein